MVWLTLITCGNIYEMQCLVHCTVLVSSTNFCPPQSSIVWSTERSVIYSSGPRGCGRALEKESQTKRVCCTQSIFYAVSGALLQSLMDTGSPCGLVCIAFRRIFLVSSSSVFLISTSALSYTSILLLCFQDL